MDTTSDSSDSRTGGKNEPVRGCCQWHDIETREKEREGLQAQVRFTENYDTVVFERDDLQKRLEAAHVNYGRILEHYLSRAEQAEAALRAVLPAAREAPSDGSVSTVNDGENTTSPDPDLQPERPSLKDA